VIRHLQFVAALLSLTFAAGEAHAQIPTPGPPPPQTSSPPIKKDKKQPKEDVEWLWQYGPPPPDGRETELVLDMRFRPFLAQFLTTPQTFWGNPKTGYKPLDETALDFLSVPDKVLADDNRSGSTSTVLTLWSSSLPSTGSKTVKHLISPAPNTRYGPSATIPSTLNTFPLR
jgi:hypothetical protein